MLHIPSLLCCSVACPRSMCSLWHNRRQTERLTLRFLNPEWSEDRLFIQLTVTVISYHLRFFYFDFQSFSELFVSFLESESEVPLSSGEGSRRGNLSNPLLSGAAHHVLQSAGHPIATSTPVGTPARNTVPSLPPSAISRPLAGPVPSGTDGLSRFVTQQFVSARNFDNQTCRDCGIFSLPTLCQSSALTVITLFRSYVLCTITEPNYTLDWCSVMQC